MRFPNSLFRNLPRVLLLTLSLSSFLASNGAAAQNSENKSNRRLGD
jgi:hypothetical protein